jgi:hypothetical protein
VFKTTDFKISKPMFAVNLAAWSAGDRAGTVGSGTDSVAAVWFQRKRTAYNGPLRTAAHGGYLNFWLRGAAPVDAIDALSKAGQHQYTAHCQARWDGSNLWCLEDEETRAEYKTLLVPMLEAYPAIPDGYSGWWHFG